MAPRSTNLHVRARRLVVDGDSTQPETVWTQNRTVLISRALEFEARCNQLQITAEEAGERANRLRQQAQDAFDSVEYAHAEISKQCELMVAHRILDWIDMLFLARSFELDPAPRMRLANLVLQQVEMMLGVEHAQIAAVLEFVHERELDAVVFVAAKWSANVPRPDSSTWPFYERGGSCLQREYENEDRGDPLHSMLHDAAVRIQFSRDSPDDIKPDSFDYAGYTNHIS